MGGSGGGGGGYYPSGTGDLGGKPKGDPCALRFEATLNGPNSDYLDMLTLSTTLSVRLGGPQGRTFELVTSQGYIVGSLIGFPQAGDLLDCINLGNTYQAQVVARLSGVISVLVERSGAP
jgi:hypothetical protein